MFADVVRYTKILLKNFLIGYDLDFNFNGTFTVNSCLFSLLWIFPFL